MHFQKSFPQESLKPFIECYWKIEDTSSTPVNQKIIPDGFPEIIFHYADPFIIDINGSQEPQSSQLFAGQIKKHFYLKNTGRSDVYGIKLKPAAAHILFGIEMNKFTDKVVPLDELKHEKLQALSKLISKADNFKQLVVKTESMISEQLPLISAEAHLVNKATEMIFKHYGLLQINDLTTALHVSERQLQRLFKSYIGLPPKLFSRIIRFNGVFQNLERNDKNWIGLAVESGFFDQAHFIRDFKNFSGEEPSKYGFDEMTIANFFIRK